ncbi:uncharacterized protein LOC124122334 isoform X2 [Haliotis rufescens]|uniref:uncharacterized protein LOC124122334 isoform X2 n=1 Tax=Haliotis rufescens TaxID=6454 RepID=UPI00201F2013|nr:uncharacterized protein LOC124122334 isoform X2 [Haliotis rufescens]
MDKLYTFTAYLYLVTCIATTCPAGSQMIWETDFNGYRIHIYGTMEGSEKAKIHVNVTMLAETNTAEICSSRKCNENQHMQLNDTCGMKIVYRQTCNMSNACYSAIYDWVMPRCPPTNNGGPTRDIAWINFVFKFKDGNQLARTCIGPGELPCSCTECQRTDACWKKCLIGFFRCVCEAESKNCTPPTDTMTNGTTTSDTITSTTTTISSEPTIAASSGPASDTAASTITTDTTASGTQTDTPTPGPASGKTTSDTLTGTASPASGTDTATPGLSSGKTASGTTTDTAFAGTDEQVGSQMGVLVGGVVGGLFGGVVITVVIVLLCRACRSRRRHTEDEDGAGTKESHTYLGLIHTTSSSGKSSPGTNAVTSQVPDLIKVSAVQQASSAPSDVYDVIKEGDDNQLGVDPSACDQGDYVDITDDMTGAAVYSLAQAAPGMAVQGGTPQPAAEYFVLEKDDPTGGDYNKLVRDGATKTGTDVHGTYNRLVRDGAAETGTDVQGTYNRLVRDGATETGTDVQGTYNRLGREGATETGTDVQGTYDRLGREGATETGTDVQGTYNRLVREGASETTTDVQGTYNKLGSTKYDNDDNEPGRNIGTAADYFVLETPEDTSNKLAQAAPGMAVQDDTPPSAAEYFVLEKDDPTDGDYNRLVRGGATETTTDVQGTYNKLGSMVDDNEDNSPAGNNGTAADYFVLEKPEDTYNKLEGKRSTEEEQEPYTKLGEATPKRESEPPDDPCGPSREYFILEDQT